ncbi:hypothetical protein LE181_30635 [Streptomyces sp. SCA3-4]|uniref:hypothetical protein n=1 Tax=Streptomyces sichuanensis TaxID=2871810 RepID=UPI001CE34C8B|nr:hypothetical protein [Streptomyces sichuanensis]MCA6096505.1 hypothetical protein [Streptomyces sichuanensis]
MVEGFRAVGDVLRARDLDLHLPEQTRLTGLCDLLGPYGCEPLGVARLHGVDEPLQQRFVDARVETHRLDFPR